MAEPSNQTVDQVDEQVDGPVDVPVVEETLVEEVSIDGMCGVY